MSSSALRWGCRAPKRTRFWRAAIKPHLTEYWIMSDFSRPEFEERCSAICGLYVDPPSNVLVVSIDEKTARRRPSLT